jgi:hypothetical protein
MMVSLVKDLTLEANQIDVGDVWCSVDDEEEEEEEEQTR